MTTHNDDSKSPEELGLPKVELKFDAEAVQKKYGGAATVDDWRAWSLHKFTTWPRDPEPEPKPPVDTKATEKEIEREQIAGPRVFASGKKRIVQIDLHAVAFNKKLNGSARAPEPEYQVRDDARVHRAFAVEIRGAALCYQGKIVTDAELRLFQNQPTTKGQ